jgi:F-type H+-transporting ATPase subunit gamma
LASLRDVRRRIASVQSTQKITRAFHIISATRLRRAQQQAEASRPYAEKMYEVLGTTSRRAREYKHPFLEQRDGRRAVMILVTADRGLAGALNVNTIRAATRRMNESYSDHPRFVTIGRKGRDFLRRFGRDVIADTSGLGDRIHVAEILPSVTVALDEYREGRCDAVLIAYAKFVSTLRQEPEVRRLVPVDLGEMEQASEQAGPGADYFYEPEAEEVMDALLPRYVESQVYQALLENKASEFAARMVAMKNATDAAGDLIDNLTLTANKVRQATITTELMEIVGGAEALRAST